MAVTSLGCAAALVCAALLGCAPPAAAVARGGAAANTPVARRTSACDAPVLRTFARKLAASILESEERLPTGPVDEVRLHGLRTIPEAIVRRQLQTRPGVPVDPRIVAADVGRVFGLEVFSDVRVDVEEIAREPAGARPVVVHVHLEERPLLGDVTTRSASGAVRRSSVDVVSGDPFDLDRLHREAEDAEARARADGHLDARVELHGVFEPARPIDVCFVVDMGRRFAIDRIELAGAWAIPAAELAELMDTRSGLVNVPGRPYREEIFARDRLVFTAHYYDRGFLTVNVGEPVVSRTGERLVVRLPIVEGPAFDVDRVDVVGSPRFVAACRPLVTGISGKRFSPTRITSIRDACAALSVAKGGVEVDTDFSRAANRVDVRFRQGVAP